MGWAGLTGGVGLLAGLLAEQPTPVACLLLPRLLVFCFLGGPMSAVCLAITVWPAVGPSPHTFLAMRLHVQQMVTQLAMWLAVVYWLVIHYLMQGSQAPGALGALP